MRLSMTNAVLALLLLLEGTVVAAAKSNRKRRGRRGLYPLVNSAKGSKKSSCGKGTVEVESTIECGDTIATDFRLPYNLECNMRGPGLIVDGATLDCGGKAIIYSSNAVQTVDSTTIGVTLRNDGKLENCIVARFYTGVVLEDGDNTVEYSVFHRNTMIGMAIEGDGENTVKEAEFLYNGRQGLLISGDGNNDLSEISSMFNDRNGIEITGDGNNDFANVETMNNARDGLELAGSGDNTFEELIVTSNQRDGIHTTRAATGSNSWKYIQIVANVNDSARAGFHIEGAGDNTVEYAEVIGNGRRGVEIREFVDGATNSFFRLQTIRNGDGSRAGLADGGVNGMTTCEQCLFLDVNNHGFYSTGTSDAELIDSSAHLNSDGIRLQGNGDYTVTGLSTSSNRGDGLEHGNPVTGAQGMLTISESVLQYNDARGTFLNADTLGSTTVGEGVYSCNNGLDGFGPDFAIGAEQPDPMYIANPVCEQGNTAGSPITCVDECGPDFAIETIVCEEENM